MKYFIILFMTILALASINGQANDEQLKKAFYNHQSNLQVKSQGVVIRLLPDDTKGTKHQRFILKLDSQQTILVAHNIDLAPKIENLHIGDTIEFYAEYEWNKKGGIIHWTHRDPDNRHPHGWLKHNGRIYE